MATEIAENNNVAHNKIAHNLLLLNQQRATGVLTVTHGKQSSLHWVVYFYLGRIVYATGGVHPVRRWYRAFKHYCPECFSTNWLIQAQSEEDLWEVDLLNQALNQGRITATQYRAVVQSVVQEVMFTLIGQKFFTTEWQASKPIAQQSQFLSVEQLIQDAQDLREQWRNCGLGFLQELMAQFSPDLAPVLRSRPQLEAQISATNYKSLLKLMRGQHTLWDVAMEMQRPLPVVLRSLLPWIRHGMIELKEVADLPVLCSKTVLPVGAIAPKATVAPKMLIACIDPNPVTAQRMAHVLKPLGYEVLPITDPLRGIATLLEQKPKLIFLDPAISHTDGYELCTFLRKSGDFQATPIVILTRNDGVVDRVRAKWAGASEFLAKPLEAAKVIQIVQKYLKAPDAPQADCTRSDCVIA